MIGITCNMKIFPLFLLMLCVDTFGQVTVTEDSTKIVIYDSMSQPVSHAQVRVNGIDFFPTGKMEDGIYAAAVDLKSCRDRYSKCYVEVFHPDFVPFADSIYAAFPVLISRGDTDYIYEINKRFGEYYLNLTYVINPDPILLEELIEETSGTVFTKIHPCNDQMSFSKQPVAWLIKHMNEEDQMRFRVKWKDVSFAVFSFDPSRQRFDALSREIVLEAVGVWKDGEAISILLNQLKSEGRIESWLFQYTQMQYQLILPIQHEIDGKILIEELLQTPYFELGFQNRTILICFD